MKIWEVRSGKLLQNLEGHRETPELCAFAPDFACTMAVSGSRDGVVHLWKINGYNDENNANPTASNRELFFFSGITRSILQCEFSPDSRIVAASSDNGKSRGGSLWMEFDLKLLRLPMLQTIALCAWDSATGKRVLMLPGQWPAWVFR